MYGSKSLATLWWHRQQKPQPQVSNLSISALSSYNVQEFSPTTSVNGSNAPRKNTTGQLSKEHFSKSQLELELAQPTANCMVFHKQSANSTDEIVNKLYNKISADTTAPGTYYKKSEAAAATQMNQHMQQLSQAT